MKKLVFLNLIFVLTLSTYAQEKQKFPCLGFDFGINHLLSVNDNFLPDFGYGAAAKIIFFSDKKLNLVSGFLFENTKYNPEEEATVPIFSDRNVLFSYYTFSVPLFLRVNPGINNNLFIEIGPSFEYTPFKWGDGAEYIYQVMDAPSIHKIYEASEPEYWKFGATASIGIKFPIKNQYLTFTTSYHNSIHALINSKPNDSDRYSNELKQYFTLKVGLIINEKK